MHENYLIGYDGSDYSNAALLEAGSRMMKYGGKATIVHVVYFDEEEFGIAPVQLEKRTAHGWEICLRAQKKLKDEYGVEAEIIIRQGEPPDVLAELAEDRKADIIALGTHGKKGLKKILLGSVTVQVAAKACSDVLIVKKPCMECTGEYGSILVAYDGSENSKKALGKASVMAKMEKAALYVLYVIPRYEEMVGFFMTESIKKRLMEEADKILEEARVISSAMGVVQGSLAQEGNTSEKIIEAAGKLKADLIVMGSQGWTGLNKALIGSTAERVILDSPCPVLVVK